MSWIYPVDAHVSDSKTIYLLGFATKYARVNGLEIPLAKNGNFAYVYNLTLGENSIAVEIDGHTETRTVIAKASDLLSPVAYAKPYVAWTDANSRSVNILRSILVDENSIMIPLAKEPAYKLYEMDCFASLAMTTNGVFRHCKERSDEAIHILEIEDGEYDLDWVYYQSQEDNIVILEDDIIRSGSVIQIPIAFKFEISSLIPEYKDGFLLLQATMPSLRAKRSNPLINTSGWIASSPTAPSNNDPDGSLLRFQSRVQNYGYYQTISIDPGHGGSQLGAISPRGIYEKDLNLQVALLLRDELVKHGKQVIMTRDADYEVSLAKRVELARAADLFISIHHNALPDARDPNLERGISLHYYHAHSRGLAKSLLSELCAITRLPRHGLYWQNLHVLRESKCPQALLLELGFLIHPEESEIIINNSYQELCIKTISKLLNY